MNATLVALVANNEESIEVKDQLKLAYNLPPNETSCLLGLGIIRSIITTSAVEESLLPKINLQVLSPISLDTIENANVIVRGCGLEFPVTMLISGYEVHPTLIILTIYFILAFIRFSPIYYFYYP